MLRFRHNQQFCNSFSVPVDVVRTGKMPVLLTSLHVPYPCFPPANRDFLELWGGSGAPACTPWADTQVRAVQKCGWEREGLRFY